MKRILLYNLIYLAFILYITSYVFWHNNYGNKSHIKLNEFKSNYLDKQIIFNHLKLRELLLMNEIKFLNLKSDTLESKIISIGFMKKNMEMIPIEDFIEQINKNSKPTKTNNNKPTKIDSTSP